MELGQRLKEMARKVEEVLDQRLSLKDLVCWEGLVLDYLSFYQSIECSDCRGVDSMRIWFHNREILDLMVSNLIPLCGKCFKERESQGFSPWVKLSVEGSFAAAHWIPGYPGECVNLHGHEWKVGVEVVGPIGSKGMLMDFKRIKRELKEFVLDPLDHSCLNIKIENPTAENLAVWTWERLMFDARLKGIERVTVEESPGCQVSLDYKGIIRE